MGHRTTINCVAHAIGPPSAFVRPLIVDRTQRTSQTNTSQVILNETRETAIKQWSATFKVSRPRAQGGDTAGRDVRATDLLACDHVRYPPSWDELHTEERVPTRD